VKIKPVLARLQNALGSQENVQNMLLQLASAQSPANENVSERSLNLVVGYDSSPDSQAALDLALLIAHQTRIATQNQVTIHVVYVLDDVQDRFASVYSPTDALRHWKRKSTSIATGAMSLAVGEATVATRSKIATTDRLERADRILWQARCLAEEWKGTFVAHLRFGSLSTELLKIVEAEAADILLLGCRSQNSPVIQRLGANFPCAVLGISE
jgi:nucleotide-binding universal stress UspA family protein